MGSGKLVNFYHSFFCYLFAQISKTIPGPWIGFKTPEKAVGSYGWVGVPIIIMGIVVIVVIVIRHHHCCVKGWLI